jgi:predicted Zn-dependent protease
MGQKGLSASLAGYAWDFNLVESPEVNAWCMPGGKVVVYSGLLPVAQDETGLAVVMGHEIAHAIARHGDERMSQSMLQEFGGLALTTYLEQKPAQTQQLWMTAYGVGTTVGLMLPYSRTHESEADHMGLIFMAMAGYDPSASLAFWERMSAGKGGAPPEFLSTHPSDQTRIANLRKLLPDAQKHYHPQG